MFRQVLIYPGEIEYQRISDLLPTIFPPEELAPRGADDIAVPYLAFYEDDELVGFARVVRHPALHYLCYMAMLPPFRGRGYGGQMLEGILAARGDVPLALDVEAPDPHAVNYEERVRRIRFYEKHGIVDSGYVLEYNRVPFWILTTGEAAAPEILREICGADLRCAHGMIRIYRRQK